MARKVGVRELRQHLSRYLAEVKLGESFTVTERGREVARLVPSGPPDSAIGRLVAERGATMPTTVLAVLGSPGGRPAEGPPSERVLEEEREERL
jgi:prevent-host-death family protein